VRRLRRMAIGATVVVTGILGGLVGSHAVGSAAAIPAVDAAGGSSAAPSGPGNQPVSAVDPFFDVAGGATGPALGVPGGVPMLRSGGS